MVGSNPWFQQNSILEAPAGCLPLPSQAPSPAFLCSQPTGVQSFIDLPLGPLHAGTPNLMGNLQPTECDPAGKDKAVAATPCDTGCSEFVQAGHSLVLTSLALVRLSLFPYCVCACLALNRIPGPCVKTDGRTGPRGPPPPM